MFKQIMFIALCFGGFAPSTMAQEFPEIYEPSGGLNVAPGDLVEFKNLHADTIVFSLSFDGVKWKLYKVKPKPDNSLILSLKPKQEAYFEIKTIGQSSSTRYRVISKKSYTIFLNEKKRWDLKENSDQ